MAANLFAVKWGQKAKITVVESPDIGIIGVGEGSTPTLKRFFRLIDVEESQWMPECHATYKVNIRFAGWSPKASRADYSHPFTTQVDTFTTRAFMVNCRTRRLGLDSHCAAEDFLLNGVLANQGKGPLTPEHFPFQMEYGYHFNSHLLGEFLKNLGKKRGVHYIKANVTGIETHPNGDIRSLTTDRGEKLEAAWFVDCSGFASVLMQKALNVNFRSYKDNLFNDSAVVFPTPCGPELPVETRSIAMKFGWRWSIPLTSRVGNGYVYSSSFTSPEQAELELRDAIGAPESDDLVRHLKMRVGQLDVHWKNNCIGLGLSQGFIEPLEATALYIVQVSIERFIALFEDGEYSARYRDDYNKEIKLRFELIRDYIVAHYKLNTREDTDYWRANRDNNHLSDRLVNLLQHWYRREDMERCFEEYEAMSPFNRTSWHCLLSGYGAFPPVAKNQPGQGDLYLEQNIKGFLSGCSLNFSSHQHNLDSLK